MNPLLRKYPRVLNNAPYLELNDTFHTLGFKHFDVVSGTFFDLQTRNRTECGLYDIKSHAHHTKTIYMCIDGAEA